MLNIDELTTKIMRMRKRALYMIYNSQSGHPGGSMSIAEILGVLYFDTMNVKPGQPDWKERDRFILSKGHGAPMLYATLCEKGFFPEEALSGFRKLDGLLQGHPMPKIPGVDVTTGSLGGGFSMAAGIAKALKIRNSEATVFAVLGDGEMNEGIIWEAAMAAAHYSLDNIVAIVDKNDYQNDGLCKDVLDTCHIKDKWQAFGWDVAESDGHDIKGLAAIFRELKTRRQGRPKMVIANTTKGYGVKYLMEDYTTHYRPPTQEEWQMVEQELA
jgi:transketolase